MTQPTLFGTNERPRHRPVRETSRQAFRVGAVKWTGRKRDTLKALERYFAHHSIPPTSAELTKASLVQDLDWTAALLYIRRGLSDLSACGAVENPKGIDGKLLKRPCAVTGSMCFVWRIASR